MKDAGQKIMGCGCGMIVLGVIVTLCAGVLLIGIAG